VESLVLNNGSLPVSIVPCKRAVILVLSDKAIALKNYDGLFFRSSFIELPIPSVIQCTHSNYVPKKFVNTLPFSRKNVYIRDKGSCMYCGKKVSLNTLTFDHVIPRSLGGKTCWENIVISCSRCNLQKGNKLASKFKRPLIRKPYAPRLDKAAPAHLVSRIAAAEIPHVTWEDFIYWNIILQP